MRLESQLTARIMRQREKNLYRQRNLIDYHEGVHASIGQQKLLVFSGNDYLGLSRHPKLMAAMQEGMQQYGVSAMASQMVVGHLAIHRRVEEAFAEFLGRDATLLFSSGYMANLGVISALADKKSFILADKYAHASLIDAAHLSQAKLLRFKHLNYLQLENQLSTLVDAQVLVLTESVFSMRGDRTDLKKCAALCEKSSASLLVDDAHAIGILGTEGKGSAELLTQAELPILICPLAKAFAVTGAVVAGSKQLIESLVQFSRSYCYTNAIPPMLAHAALTSLTLVRQENWRREKLFALINYFKQRAKLLDISLLASNTPIQIIEIGDAERASNISAQLFLRGFLLHAMRPPTVPPQSSCLRVSLSCLHTEKQIDELLLNIKKIYEDLS